MTPVLGSIAEYGDYAGVRRCSCAKLARCLRCCAALFNQPPKPNSRLTLGWLWEPGTARAQSLETYLLNRYEADHGELPPLNVTAGRDVSVEPRFAYPWEHTHGRGGRG